MSVFCRRLPFPKDARINAFLCGETKRPWYRESFFLRYDLDLSLIALRHLLRKIKLFLFIQRVQGKEVNFTLLFFLF